MVIKIEKITEHERAFFFSYFIFLLFGILSQSFYYKYFSGVYKYIIAFCCIILFFKEIQVHRLSKRGGAGLLICVLLFFLTFTVSQGARAKTVPAMFIFIYSSRNIKFEKIAKYTLVFSSFLLIFVIFSAYIGLIDDYTITQMSQGIERTRHYVGFRYALFPSTILFNISCLFMYINKQAIKLWQVIILLFLNYWMYLQTDSRFMFYGSVVILLLSILLKYFFTVTQERKVILLIGTLCFPISFFISFILTWMYNPSVTWINELNRFLGNRLRLGQTSLLLYGIRMVGQDISWVGNGLDVYGNASTLTYSYVDSFYVQTLQHYGVIFVVVFLILMTLVMLKVRKQDIYLYIILVTIAVHYIIDDLQLYLYYNTFWLVIGNVLVGSVYPWAMQNDKRKIGNVIDNRKRII